MINPRAVKITWVDAESTSEWTAVAELTDPEFTTTLGYLVKETDSTYFVASSIRDNKGLEVGDTIAIPKGWAKEVLDINDGTKKKTSRRIKAS